MSQAVYPTYIRISNVQTPTTFITQTNQTSAVRASIGYNYSYLKDRVTIYGGNLNVSQNVASSNDYMGKWSTMGAWQMLYNIGMVPMNVPIPVTPGVNYLVDYHRWGNYDAHFGLRERMSDIGVYSQTETGGGSTYNDPNIAIKDAVLSFSYENGATPSRFIIQTIQGIDAAAMRLGSGTYPVSTELATVLSNGNFGLGVSNPTAKLQIMTNTGMTNDYLRIGNTGGVLMVLNNLGNLGIGTSSPGNNRLYVEGATTLNGNTNINGVTTIIGSNVNVTSQLNLKSPMNATSTFPLLKLQSSNGDVMHYVNHKGDFYLSKLANGSDNQVLYINSDGLIYGDSIVKPTNTNTFLIGGNTANSYSDKVFGFNDNANIVCKVNGEEVYKVWGKSQIGINTTPFKTGFVDFRRNVSIGGLINQPLTADYLSTLTLYQGQFMNSDNTLSYHMNFINAYDRNGYQRFKLATNGDFGLGINSYQIGNTSYQTGVFYNKNLEHLFLDDNNSLYLGYDQSGYKSKYSSGNSYYGLFINNRNGNVINQISIGENNDVTVVSNIGSIFSGDIIVRNDIIPDIKDSSSLGSNTSRMKALFTKDIYVNGKVYGDLLLKYSGSYNIGSNSVRWNGIYGINVPNSASDLNLKTNIKVLNYGLKELLQLKPVTFEWKQNNNGTRLGFIAQELKTIIPEVVTVDDSTGLHGVYYSEIIPLLTKSIQEQQKMIDSLKIKVSSCIEQQYKVILDTVHRQTSTIESPAFILQNRPNPFSDYTFIDYYTPCGVKVVYFIRISDSNGKLVQSIQIEDCGYGQIELDCRNLKSGNYIYSLINGSEVVDSKTMSILKN